MNKVPGSRISAEYASDKAFPHDFTRIVYAASHARAGVPGSAVNPFLRMMWRRTADFAKQ
jgi:hypothetical protein